MDSRLDIKSLNKLFKPSSWSKRYSTPEQVLSEHAAITKTESDRVRRTIPFEVVQYGETFTNETFDIYGIDLPKDAPIFVYIHGGYWQALDKTSSAYVVEPLYRAGHKVIVLDYDLCPTVTLEQLVDQVQRAGISIINYATSMGTKGIQLAGHSAGAHLVAFVFDKLIDVQQSPPLTSIVKSLYLISGIYDLCEARFMVDVNPDNILSLDENNVLRLSPILFDFNKWTAAVTQCNARTTATKSSPTAIHLYSAAHDAPKLTGQTYCLERLLASHQYPNCDLILLQNTDHFDIVENLSKPDFSITKLIIAEAKLFASNN